MRSPVPRWILPLIFLPGFIPSCTAPVAPTATPVAKSAPEAKIARTMDVEAKIARMTVEQKIAQLFVIGFDGTGYGFGLREMVEKYGVGGVIFFARNVESPAQVARLTNELQASARKAGSPGLLISIDQEGGRVARLTADKGFTEFPGAMALSATARDVAEAAKNVRRAASSLAVEMRAVGINADFAPDLDVNNNPANPVIGIRSFSSDPARAAALGAACIEGLQGEGVLAFGKHFPGHGDTGTDSHVELPIVNHPRARLEAVEFVPFRAAIAAGVAGIMSAHVSFPTIDDTPGLPGTLSPKVLGGLLRDELHFDGLVVTDSLEMGALTHGGFPTPVAASRALRAGADLLLFNSGYSLHQAAIAQIAADIRAGTIPMATLDRAVRRVLNTKVRFSIAEPVLADAAKATEICGSLEHRALADTLAGSAITLLRDGGALLPLAVRSRPIVVAGPSAGKLAEWVDGEEIHVADSPTDREVAAVLSAVRARPMAPVVLTLAGARPGSRQIVLARQLVALHAHLVVVALREPYDLLSFARAEGGDAALVASYGANPPTLRALAAMLRGEAKPMGHLPVDLPGMFPLGAGLTDFPHR